MMVETYQDVIKQTTENQLHADLLSINGLQPFPGANSSSRAQMMSSHLSQRLNTKGAQTSYIQTGMERELGKYTFSVSMPCDGRIIKILDRYRKTIGESSIENNPLTLVIYEDVETNEVGVIELPKYFSAHQYFGFAYEARKGIAKLVVGNIINKGTIFLDSPAVDEQGNYNYGMEANMAFMSHPSVSEDGAMVRRGYLDKLKFKTFETRTVDFGSKKIPLNLYGDAKKFKAFPDIGDTIKDDGLLMMFRPYDPLLSPVEMSIYDLMEPDPAFDEAVYAAGPGGKIIDIRVFSDRGTHKTTPEGIDTQPNKYADSGRVFYNEIIEEWKRLHRLRGQYLKITKEFHSLVIEAMINTDDGSQSKIEKIHRLVPLDDYRIQFVIEYETTPGIGFKITDLSGGLNF